MAGIQGGRLEEAEAELRSVLVLVPDDAEACKLYGVSRLQRADWQGALAPARRSAILRGLAYDWSNFGVALQCSHQLAEAEGAFRRSVIEKPEYHEGLNNLGVVLRAQGRFAEALASFRRALNARPDYVDARNNLAGALLLNGDPALAAEAHRASLRQRPDQPGIHFQLACALGEMKEWAKAANAFRRAIALRPDHVEAYDGLGNILRNAERHPESFAAYVRCGRLAPHQVFPIHNQARSLLAQRRPADALTPLRFALTVNPDDANALNVMGMAFNDMKRHNDAATVLKHAVRLAPDFGDAMNNLGNALLGMERLEESIACYRHAIAIDPFRAGIPFSNMGTAIQRLNRLPEAERCYRRAMVADTRYTRSAFHLSMVLLLDGRFREGWEMYESRAHIPEADKRSFQVPLWKGEPLAGKRVLLFTEQGFGDTLQMLRYVPLLTQQAAAVYLETPPPMMRLAASLPGGPALVEMGKPVPPIDYRCSLMSLPYRLGCVSEAKIPANVPYLSAPPELTARWGDAIGRGGRPRVGLAWAGNPAHGNDRARSMPAELVRPLLDVDGIEFILIQKEPRPAEQEVLMSSGRCRAIGPLVGDFADTAGLLSALDLLISVDTSVGHLAGALGRPVWMMIPFSPDWRWLMEREDSPWYPTLRLFRQTAPGDWPGVVARVGEELARWVDERRKAERRSRRSRGGGPGRPCGRSPADE
ncbi:tetratricopeptide repeat protein [Azospirillum sp. sgz302134]